jgi:U3 small nucleolar RNA-associated protein 3
MLSLGDAQDKAAKRHTLRFHVSQVNQKQKRREAGNGRRVGGDDDIPLRSKERARREVLKRQEHGGAKGEALDGGEWDEDDKVVADSVRGGATAAAEEDYYDLVKTGKEVKRKTKKENYDQARAAEKFVSIPTLWGARGSLLTYCDGSELNLMLSPKTQQPDHEERLARFLPTKV